jgi:hypothetical protein
VIVEKTYGSRIEHAAKFCPHCSMPAPWTTRQERIVWLSDRVRDEPGLGEAEIVELQELLNRLVEMSPGDQHQLPVWQKVQAIAPKAWAASKPILQSVIADSIKRYVGL